MPNLAKKMIEQNDRYMKNLGYKKDSDGNYVSVMTDKASRQMDLLFEKYREYKAKGWSNKKAWNEARKFVLTKR